MLGCPIFESGSINLPHLLAMELNFLALFKLGIEKGSQHVRRQIGRANIYPRIFIDLPAEESRAICPFFAYDLCPFHYISIIYDERATFATGEVLCLVKRLRCHGTKCSKKLSLVFTKESVCV